MPNANAMQAPKNKAGASVKKEVCVKKEAAADGLWKVKLEKTEAQGGASAGNAEENSSQDTGNGKNGSSTRAKVCFSHPPPLFFSLSKLLYYYPRVYCFFFACVGLPFGTRGVS